MIVRKNALESTLLALSESPATALIGPRQIGKTTLALAAGQTRSSVYIDLELPEDRAKLASPENYFSDHIGELVILDEIHRAPELFPVLRGQIDRARRAGYPTGQYLILGSASLDLLQHTGESLAGRIAYVPLAPLSVAEIADNAPDASAFDRLWVRGGFPESYQAKSYAMSLRWRENFIRTYLERDVPQFGFRLPATQLRRMWTMLAHLQGSILNVAHFARNLGVDVKTAAGYINVLENLLLIRKLAPWHSNAGKRLVKSPKVYVRDSGLVHALLGIADKDALLSHPVIGASWEGFVLENILSVAGQSVEPSFYRANGGAEIDLILQWRNGQTWAIEIKRSTTPKLERGFFSACEDVKPAKKFVVYPGAERYRIKEDVVALPLIALLQELAG